MRVIPAVQWTLDNRVSTHRAYADELATPGQEGERRIVEAHIAIEPDGDGGWKRKIPGWYMEVFSAGAWHETDGPFWTPDEAAQSIS